MRSTSGQIEQQSAFDVVGVYQQDLVNGYGDAPLREMLRCAELETASAVLDAMAGDGNFTERMVRYSDERNFTIPRITTLEYSRVQSEFAAARLQECENVEVVWGDVLTMASRADGSEVPRNAFDRVLIKSANHEISADQQAQLYQNIYNILQPGGLFINLGMLFDDSVQRDELRHIAYVKDSLAGMEDAARHRHFLCRDELYGYLQGTGFTEVASRHPFYYRIGSEVVRDTYFQPPQTREADIQFQSAQIAALAMRRSDMIHFSGDTSVMECPGEITVARKPSVAEQNAGIYNQYPYDFLRNIACHREMLALVSSYIQAQERVLDLGCGLGLFYEHLSTKSIQYRGVDLSSGFISSCKERYEADSNAEFVEGDLNTFSIESDTYHAISLINVLYQPNIEPIKILQRALHGLKRGGKLLIAGPISPESYLNAEPEIVSQLQGDGLFEEAQGVLREIREANDRLLRSHGNYWSAEGMSTLLRTLGARQIISLRQDLYYGNAFLVVAEK